MRRFLIIGLLLSAPACAATPADVLSANEAATAGPAWSGKAALSLRYAYSGQGLMGTQASLEDLKRGAFVDSYDIGPQSGATGFDGEAAWEKEPSGTVTDQSGGDVIPLAVTEAYQDQNLWWREDRGGAAITSLGTKNDDGAGFDILEVAPKGGTPFEVWFDQKSHLLARTVEANGTQSITTFYSDYAPVDGVAIARKIVVDDGSGAANRQTLTLIEAAFLGPQPSARFAKPAENLHDYSIANGASQTTVPFRLLNNHIYADVSVNGSKPLTFIFDTGGHTILTTATARAIDVAFKGSQTVSGGGNSLALSGVTTLARIQVGGVILTDQPASVLPFSAPGVEGAGEAGMLGYELFARFVTRIDYGHRTLTFIDKKHFVPKDAGAAVPIRLYHQFPEVLGTYDGMPARFGIDTGSRMTLMLTGPFARDHDIRAGVPQGIEAMTGWGVGGASYGYVFRGGTLKLGGVTINHPLTSISTDKGGSGASPAFPNNVGDGILKRFVVTLDYGHSTMYLKPVEGAVADLDTFDRSGMWINATDDGFKIIDVTKGGPAEAAGLAKDDIITRVDGKPANAIPIYTLREQLRDEAPGTVAMFTIKRGSETKDVAVTLRDLI